ncbi:MAG: exodeoxyribonuclease VII small subunit [Lachnospiraceae bacterium]|nr:exodeoxyribonuclease VII small subunit [Lachnospiraceae bacterium]MBP3609939.1 exodeoxyribonuclease VII small subunit [Lachnospiraceae bacterium]
MAGRKKAETEEKKEPGLEQSLAELELVMEELSAPGLSLEESFAKYKQGMDLLLQCNRAIDKVEKELTILEENGIDEF